MIDGRDLLQRASETIAAPPDPMDRLIRRRDRKRRNQRIGAGVLALMIALLGIGTAIRVFSGKPTAPASPRPHPMPVYHHNGTLMTANENGYLTAIDPVTGFEGHLPNGSNIALPPPPESASSTTTRVAYQLAISPDGTKVAYAATRLTETGYPPNGRLGVYVLDLLTGRAVRIFPCRAVLCGNASWVGWSPDGSRIAFAEGGRITLMDPDGRNRLVIVDMGDNLAINGRPAWSPDGTRIAFTRRSATSGVLSFRLYTVAADGSDLTVVIERPILGWWGDPAWSPDGSRIAYEAFVLSPGTNRLPFEAAQVWVVRPDGSARTKIFQSPKGCLTVCGAGPVWSPDGTKMAFLAPENELFVMNADGTNPRLVASGPEGGLWWSGPVWQPLP